jgi:hypothetical protein
MTLENKLKTVKTNVLKRLQESEIKEDDIYNFLFSELKDQEILTGSYSENTGNVGRILGGLERNTLYQVRGLQTDYFANDNTPFSEEAKEDIKAYQDLTIEAKNYVDTLAEPLTLEQFADKMHEFVKSKNLMVRETRRGSLVARYTTMFENSIEIKNTEEKFGNYTKAEISDALNKI